MPVPHLENATALVTEYAHHQQDNTLTTFGLEPPGPHTLLLKAVLQVHPPPSSVLISRTGPFILMLPCASSHSLHIVFLG